MRAKDKLSDSACHGSLLVGKEATSAAMGAIAS